MSVYIEPGNDSMAANVDDATDPVSKAVALNIVSGHVAAGTLNKELPKC